MGLGNDNPKVGDLGSNYNYQLKVLKALQAIMGSTGGGATEATLLMVLAALQNGQEFEQNLVTDLGGVGCPANCPTYLQVRIFNTETHTFDPPIYYNAAGVVVVPVGPLQLVNPQFVLDNILVQLQAINADLDVSLSTRASEATLAAISVLFDVPLSTLATEGTLLNVETALNTLTGTDFATETTLLNVDANLLGVSNILSLIQADLDGTNLQPFRNAGITNVAIDVSGGAPATLWGWNIINPNATPVYVKIYDLAAGSVVVGATAIVMTLMIPGNGSVFQEPNVRQLACSTALSLAAVTGLADANAVAPASAILVEMKFKF